MQTTFTKIGNSKGLIIPQKLIKQCGFENEVTMEVKNNGLMIYKTRKPREGWSEAIQAEGADELLMADIPNDFDEDEWQW